jgi:hypothetical protein
VTTAHPAPHEEGAESEQQRESIKLTKYSGKKVGWTIRAVAAEGETLDQQAFRVWKANQTMEQLAAAEGYTFE